MSNDAKQLIIGGLERVVETIDFSAAVRVIGTDRAGNVNLLEVFRVHQGNIHESTNYKSDNWPLPQFPNLAQFTLMGPTSYLLGIFKGSVNLNNIATKRNVLIKPSGLERNTIERDKSVAIHMGQALLLQENKR